MITIVMANRKGGVGKSTLSVHLAWFLAKVMKKRVLFVDLDDQANSSATLAPHRSAIIASALFSEAPIATPAPIDGIALVEADAGLNRVLKEDLTVVGEFVDKLDGFKDAFDFCVIDTSPAWNRTTEAAMLAADYFATPVDVETYALQGLNEFLNNTRRMMTFKQRNGGGTLNFLGIIANRVSNTSPIHKQNLAQLKEAHPTLTLDAVISQRTNIGDAISEGIPVWELQKSAAREAGKEMRLLFTQLLQRMAQFEATRGAA